ncbi:unnamed protein product [Victoria cruziana]
MARWYVNELVHYGNEASEVQGLESESRDGATQSSLKMGCSNIEETIISHSNISGRYQIYDGQEEYTALRECITLSILTICLIDTNCDPDITDILIPANDDVIASMLLILNKLGNMNVLPCSINTLKGLYEISGMEVGQHFYWQIGGFQVHAQVLITSWVVIAILLSSAAITVWNPQTILTNAKLKLEKKNMLPHGELAAPMNDINTTIALALPTSVAYFYAGLTKKGLGYFSKYIQPTLILLPINVLEDFTKPLSLSFQLFMNILADELVVVVLVSLVPLVIPIPVMLFGLFTSSIQALIFTTLAATYIAESMEGHH